MDVFGGGRAPRAAPEEDVEGGEAQVTEIFASYKSSVRRGQPHPGDIAEASSLSAIPLPPTDYPLFDAIPEELVASGKLSQLQLEGILYACSRHQELLPSGERAGFFVGDGAGVGKGRQIAGCILDNYARGRRRAVWLSTSGDLHKDATRDLRDLGCHIPVINNLQTLDRETKALGLAKELQEGVLFITYSTLVSGTKGGRSRLDQVIDWLRGESFDGLLIFDECHRAKNFVPGKESQSTKVATAVIELQTRLPKARVLYCSATGVSEVSNTAYLSRMHMWGPGTAFSDFEAFLDAMKRRGVSFLEMMAMEMKAAGKYVARGLSFRDAEFLENEAPLSQRQAAAYDAAAELWRDMRQGLERAMELTTPPASAAAAAGRRGGGGGGGGGDVWKPFWGAHQRFFKLLCVSLKVPTVVEEAKAALLAGQCVVIGLQSTGEAAADAAGLTPGPVPGFVSTTREVVLRFLETHFPVAREPPAELAAAGALPHPVPEAAALRAALRSRAEALPLPPNFLDQLIDELGGPDAVAEMTGRKGRIVRDRQGRTRYELRARPDSTEMDSLNVHECAAFMAGRKLVAILSDAASTGISLHANRGAKNTRRRVHLTVELPWSADKAIQQLGRSHRSNQVTAPIYKLITTQVGGERRFAAAVARRLQSLGALTRGDRRAASGIDLSESNFDSPWGRKSLRKMYDHIVQESPTLPSGVTLSALLRDCPEELRSQYSRWLPKTAPAASAGSVVTSGVTPVTNGVTAGGMGSPGVTVVAEFGGTRAAGAMGAMGGAMGAMGGAENAVAYAMAVSGLHRELRECCDVMAVGLGAPRSDTVAEDRTGGAATAGGGGKDLGDVRRFLNRILGLPLAKQNLLFSYFAATLSAEIAAAKAEGRYSEGVSDLLGSSITLKGEPQVLWSEPGSSSTAQRTLIHTLLVDRGLSFPEASRRLRHEQRPGDDSGFRRSRRPVFGGHLVLLALQKPGHRNIFSVVRPNTGESPFDMERSELETKYSRIDEDSAKEEWDAAYSATLNGCMHGAHCVQGPSCQVGRRQIEVTLLTGAVVRVWAVLESLIEKRSSELPKADRAMRVVRVALGPRGGGCAAAAGAAGSITAAAAAASSAAAGTAAGGEEEGQRAGKEEESDEWGTGEEEQQQPLSQQQPSQQQQEEEGEKEQGQRQQQQRAAPQPSYLVGVRYPSQLLPEVRATLDSLQVEALAQLAAMSAAAGRNAASPLGGGSAAAAALAAAAAAAAAGGVGGNSNGLQVGVLEPPTPVDQKSLAKALRAPKTLHDFFSSAPRQGSAGAGGGGGTQQQQQQQQAGLSPGAVGGGVAGKAAAKGTAAAAAAAAAGGSAGRSGSGSLSQTALKGGQQQLVFGPASAAGATTLQRKPATAVQPTGKKKGGGGQQAKGQRPFFAAAADINTNSKRPASVIVIDEDSVADAAPNGGSGNGAAEGAADADSGPPPPDKRPRLEPAAPAAAAAANGGGGGKGGGGGGGVEEAIGVLLGMGFAEAAARRALWATSGSVDRAVEWLLLNGAA